MPSDHNLGSVPPSPYPGRPGKVMDDPDLQSFLRNIHGITLGADGEFTEVPPKVPPKKEPIVSHTKPWLPSKGDMEPPF